MSIIHEREQLLESFILDSSTLLESLEQIILHCEKSSLMSDDSINETFRIMHTIKGGAALMMFDNMATLSHRLEDIFFFIRDKKPKNLNTKELSVLLLTFIDFMKNELINFENGNMTEGNSEEIMNKAQEFNDNLTKITPKKRSKKKQSSIINEAIPSNAYVTNDSDFSYQTTIFFIDDCAMENIRAVSFIHEMQRWAKPISCNPLDLSDGTEANPIIQKTGFTVTFATCQEIDFVQNKIMQTIFLKDYSLEKLNKEMAPINGLQAVSQDDKMVCNSTKQSFVNVNIHKLDALLDLVGELVISESMVTGNPEVNNLKLKSFIKAARYHRKIISELQDLVLSVRMVPLSSTFLRMNRIVHDMTHNLGKEANLVIIGENTEVDKNIIDYISDPLMHLIRNSLDHGIENPNERELSGKSRTGTITLEARNSGGEVLIYIRDDGKGLNKSGILSKAKEKNLLVKPENEMTDKEIYSLILLPGFSTNENVSQYSGRGVGMDVVTKNIETVGGKLIIESRPEIGTTFIIRLPLTLAIISGMQVEVGNSKFTIPLEYIRESLKPTHNRIVIDNEENEMIMIRGECSYIKRIHKLFNIQTKVTDISDGILVVVDNDGKTQCLLVDKLVGEGQVVVKALPRYLRKIKGISGCTIMGDGSISLIMDVPVLFSNE